MTRAREEAHGSALILVRAFLEADQLATAREYLSRLDPTQRNSLDAAMLEVELLFRENRLSDIDAVLAQAESVWPPSARVEAFLGLTRARIDYIIGNVRSANERLATLLFTVGDSLESKDRTDIHYWLANCLQRQRGLEEARGQYELALGSAEGAAYSLGIVRGLVGMAMCEQSLGLWDRAFALLDRALQEAEHSRNHKLVQTVTSNLAVGRLFAGQFEISRRLLRSYLALAIENKDAVNLPLAHAAIGLLYTRTRELALARQHLLTAHRLANKGRLVRPLALSCEYLGELALAEQRLPRAKRWLRQAIRIAEPAGLRDIVGEAGCRLAEVELLEGDAEAALVRAKRCLADFESMHDFYEVAVSRRVVGQILIALGRRVEALDELDQSLTAFQSLSEQFESKRVQFLQEAASRGDIVLDIRAALSNVERTSEASQGDASSSASDEIRKSALNDQLDDQPSAGENAGQHAGTDTQPTDSMHHRSDGDGRFPRSRAMAKHTDPKHHPDFPELLGRSAALLRVLEQAKTFARAEAPILMEGETGTGKELLARAIHRLSARGNAPFVPFNCGTSTPEMLDSELFGHERGAFTGAASTRAGLARKAHQGTLFLDEIAELPSIAQPKLLRLIDSGELRSVGSDELESVDIRLLSATHQDLAAAVAAGRFREDLLFRLSTFRLRLPPLRRRLEDLPILIEHFSEEARRRGYPEFAGLSARVLDQMSVHTWPGNLRELRNSIFHIAGTAAPGRLVTEWTRPLQQSDGETRVIDRATVVAAIEEARGNLTIAARHLGISRGRLYRNLSRWGIDPTDLRG